MTQITQYLKQCFKTIPRKNTIYTLVKLSSQLMFQTVAVNLGDTRSTSLIWTTKAAYSAFNTTYIGLEFLSLGITLP